MRARNVVVVGLLASASACANVLGLDFVDTQPNSGGDGGANMAHDGPSTTSGDDDDDSGGHLDSATSDGDSGGETTDGSPGNGGDGGTSGDAATGSVVNPCPDAGSPFVVTFPVPTGSICASVTADVVTLSAASATVASNDTTGSFSGVTLNLPQSYFAGFGAVCVMDLTTVDGGVPAHTGPFRLINVAGAKVDLIVGASGNVMSAGSYGHDDMTILGNFTAAVSSTLEVGFLISISGEAAIITPYSSLLNGLADSGAVFAALDAGAFPIQVGIDFYDGGRPFLEVFDIRCAPYTPPH